MAKHSLFSAILINSPAKLRQPELPHGLHYPGNIYIKTCGFARTSVLCIFSPLRLTMATYFAINDAKSPIDLHGANDKSATPPARLTQPWQNRHQNVRLGRENSSITFFAVTRYHGDVIRDKLNPIDLEWGQWLIMEPTTKALLLPHGSHNTGNIYIKTCGLAGTTHLLLFLPLRVTMAT